MKKDLASLRLQNGSKGEQADRAKKGVALIDSETGPFEGYLVDEQSIEGFLKAAGRYELKPGDTATKKIRSIEFVEDGYDALVTEVEYALLQIAELATSVSWLMDSYEEEVRAEQYAKPTALIEAIEDKLTRVKNYLAALQERHLDERHNLEGLGRSKV